jgi:anti-sigma factor RsiW
VTVEKLVGGLTCFEVLERLSDFLDGELSEADRARVEAHLAGCDACTRFGGEFGQVVRALRQRLDADTDVPPSAARKLDEALGR